MSISSCFIRRGCARWLPAVAALLMSIPLLFSAAPAQADPLPQLSINDVAQGEGNSGTTFFSFTVSLDSPAPAGGVTFDITTFDQSATTSDGDYIASSLTGQTIAAGNSSYTFNVTVNGDTAYESNESFLVNVSNVVGATVLDGQGEGTIGDDDPPLTGTTTTLASNQNPSEVGQSVTFTATVTSGGSIPMEIVTSTSGTPTGTVTFSVDSAPQTPVVLDASGTATFTTSSLSVGTHTIEASYSGDATFASSAASPLSQTVNFSLPVMPTTTILSSSPNPSSVGDTVTFTATVVGGFLLAGTVEFFDGSTSLGTAPLFMFGSAILSTSSLSAGAHSITAVYSGDIFSTPSTSAPLIQMVNTTSSPTTTTLVSSANPSQIGQSVTFTATVTSSSGTPTGMVTFLIDGAPQAPLTLDASGVATFTISSLSVGTHTIEASYSGGTNFMSSTAAPLTQTVNTASTITLDVATLTDGAAGVPYSQLITASGGSGSYTFAVTSGALPPGLTLAADGTLSGTPTQAGTYSFTVTVTDTGTSLTGEGAYTLVINTVAATATPTPPPPPPPPALHAEDVNFDDVPVRTGIPESLVDSINVRVLYQNGSPTSWLGNALYDGGSIGNPGILELGVQQAIDIFSPNGQTYFNGGAVFCLRGQGTLIWLAASGVPRRAEIIGSYAVDDYPGYTCATLFEPGTLVLVSESPR